MKSLQDRYYQLLSAQNNPKKTSWGGATPQTGTSNLTSDVVNLVLSEAITHRTSDIHFEPFLDHLRIRFRIDGKLYEVLKVLNATNINIIARIKILSNLATDAMSSRKPLDGRFSAHVGTKDFDFRVATFPTIMGEKVAIRILNKDFGMINLAKIGLNKRDQARLEQIIQRKNGLLIVSGPTGSGKTSTLYSILNRLHSPHVNIVTLEDPVEYQIDGINQCDIKQKGDDNFAAGLKAILRQDPNIVLIGEIRDHETADIAIRAALTGHLVMTSLHANNAIGTAVRLINMGLERYMVSYAIIGAVAQRLVPRLCDQCRVPYKVNLPLLQRICDQCGIPIEAFLPRPQGATEDSVQYGSEEADLSASTAEITLYKSTGCETCSGTGYFGRMGIFEVLFFTDELREAIIRNATMTEMKDIAYQKGFRTLAHDAIEKVKAGHVTMEDIYPILLESSL
jgi:type II secretory ATPase GspE/PulE/Tfp pilus assembly ATPase PilB-like protein